jgi:Hsp70 protein
MTEPTQYKFLPLTLSLETSGGVATSIVRRGTPLPAKRKQQFSTTVDNQKAVRIEVYLGESPIAAKNIHIGQVELTGLTEAPRGEPQIDVLFEVDQTCRIAVTATEKKTGTVMTSVLQMPPEHMVPERLEGLLRTANDSCREDEEKVKAIEARNAANSLVHKAEKYLQELQLYGFGNSTDRQIEETLASLGLALQQDDSDAIRDKSKRLQQLLPDANLGNFGAFFGGGAGVFDGIFGKPTPFTQRRPQPTADTQTSQKPTSPPKPMETQSEEVAESKKGLFAAGQHFDAKRLLRDLFAQATGSIVIIDGYVGEDVLNLLTVKREEVNVRLLTGKVSPAFLTLARDFARQYKGLEVRSSKVFHDRFIIVDDTHCYHFGASLEHLGSKTFMFSKIEELFIKSALIKQWDEVWNQAAFVL